MVGSTPALALWTKSRLLCRAGCNLAMQLIHSLLLSGSDLINKVNSPPLKAVHDEESWYRYPLFLSEGVSFPFLSTFPWVIWHTEMCICVALDIGPTSTNTRVAVRPSLMRTLHGSFYVTLLGILTLYFSVSGEPQKRWVWQSILALFCWWFSVPVRYIISSNYVYPHPVWHLFCISANEDESLVHFDHVLGVISNNIC